MITERLKLVPTNVSFAEDIFINFTYEVTALMYPDSPTSIDDTKSFIQGAVRSNELKEDNQVVITDKVNGEFLGCAGLHNINTKTPEFGIWLKKSAQGKGYALETITALKLWADENLDYEFLSYPVDRNNTSSRALPETLGGVIEAEYKLDTPKGTVLDCVEYRIYPDKK